ncbi:Uncharacterised protein [Bordetella pertussis]|nr:Uncharacterised protein [Bordetella pertussis]
MAGRQREDLARGQFLACFPAGEWIRVVRRQQRQVGVAPVVFDDDRRREAAQQRRHRHVRHLLERPAGARLGQFEQHGVARRLAVQVQRQRAALRVEQADRERNVECLFGEVASGAFLHADRGAALGQRDGATAALRVVIQLDADARRARLAVPAAKHRQVAARIARGVDRFHGGDEIVAGHGLSVVAPEVLVHAGAESRLAQQGVLHADHFGAFLVHGGGIEVADLLVAVGPDGVGHRAGILGELGRAQRDDIVDALDRARARGGLLVQAARHHVGAEFLVAEYRQAFLEAQLKPVAAGDAVAGPVVEVFVADDGFDAFVVGVGGGGRVGQHIGRVEDVQALVFHRAHVEVAYRDHHEAVQVQLQAEARLVPAQRVAQGFQRPFGAVLRTGIAVDLQQHIAARLGAHALFAMRQAAGHQREQIAGLGKRIFPFRLQAAIGQGSGGQQIAIGQQHRIIGRRAQRHAITRHDVGPVGEPGNAAKALGLALGEEIAAGDIQPHQGGIGGGPATADNFDRRAGRQAVQGQGGVVQDIAVTRPVAAVDTNGNQLERFAVQHQRRIVPGIGLARHLHEAAHGGRGGIQVEFQRHVGDGIRIGLIILAVYGDGRVCAHGLRNR